MNIGAILAKNGINAHCFDTVESTNTLAKQAAMENEKEWTVFVADRQTGGRGRMGRQFYSPDGGLYFSVILRRALTCDTSLLITTAAAVAARDAIRSVFGKDADIKWVNDIILSGKKVCGILAESAIMGNTAAFTVLGLGVNLFGDKTAVPDELKNIMGFVSDAPADEQKKAAFIAEFLKGFKGYYVNLENKPHLFSYRENLIVGCEATILRGDREEGARIIGLDDDFKLIAATEKGEEKLSFGEVRLRL
ncbi:MAG: biotin--[Clostridia bacterium]|nr:biotin--[acetyl-CoA-carboxylase] ligase [Clostridia bacterium]